MKLEHVESTANQSWLTVVGAFHPKPTDGLPDVVKTLVLLGPLEPGFWGHFTTSKEYNDTQPDPLDRWSDRVISTLGNTLNANPYFPFGGPPFQPFIRWAQSSDRAHLSPVGLLVHDHAGMMVSYRGALGFATQMNLPETAPSPCLSCEKQPCKTACPVDAFAGGGYDVAACKADLDTPESTCVAKGCAARRACPISQAYGRVEPQSAFHMEAFR